ncbi:MAG: DUF2812 domain-containing protein [Firmicutes bacterium]|nr:DUF2812 domain-containing protein [Bacillota bacterium]
MRRKLSPHETSPSSFEPLCRMLKKRRAAKTMLFVYLFVQALDILLFVFTIVAFATGEMETAGFVVGVVFCALLTVPTVALIFCMRGIGKKIRALEGESGQKIRVRRRFERDILACERWLNGMHREGDALAYADLGAGRFFFIRAESATVFYRIGSKPADAPVPPEFTEGGRFTEICASERRFILKTELADPPLSPSYEGELNRALKIKSRAASFLVGYGVIFGVLAALIISFLVSYSVTEKFDLAMVIVFSVLLSLFFIPLIPGILRYKRVARTVKPLEGACDNPFAALSPSFSPKELEKLKKEKKYVKKIRFFWLTAPDLCERWLEKMEGQGWNLAWMGKFGGSFHFIKGEPRRIKYFVDYHDGEAEYYSLHKDNGWTLVYSARPISVWSHGYVEQPPVFYNDPQILTRHAKALALVTPICSALLNGADAVFFVMSRFAKGTTFFWVSGLILLPYIAFLGWLTQRCIRYYLRVRAAIKNIKYKM